MGFGVRVLAGSGYRLFPRYPRVYLCHSLCIGLPIDLRKGLVMNDANGGEGYLKGLVENVPLTCGGVETQTNLYVGANVPFDLLLGCPWQRGDFVSIDERTNETYLVSTANQTKNQQK